MDLPEKLLEFYRNEYSPEKTGTIAARAPGRIEILGNHTDYNGGRVLNATIDRFVWMLGRASEDVRLSSLNFDETIQFSPKEINPSSKLQWGDYARGVYWAFQRRRHRTRGVEGAIFGDIRIGAGLSSSAAFEVALANLVARISEIEMHPKALAMIAFEAERLFCRVSCGIQDQFAANLGRPDALLGIHAASMQTQHIPVPREISFITIDSMVQRKAVSILNRRRQECQRALMLLREGGYDISNICALSQDDLSSVEDLLEESLLRRVKHLVDEHARVVFATDALNAGKVHRFGELMYESHYSSRDLYEVSHENLDLLVDLLRKQENVFGARLTGAGSGGAVVACVASNHGQDILGLLQELYEDQTGIRPEGMICAIPGGAVTRDL